MAQLPPSTAEVIEYRCQYTHNVVQKRKKWNDGCLKFHTFNKLVRIFDEDNNHVCQKHWQGKEALHDGDEFQLDNMLVCVQDLLRSTQTNVAPLFEKRRKQPLLPPSQSQANYRVRIGPAEGSAPAFAQSVASTAARSQHKSLTALLGMNRGVIGKAVAPRSPFEARNSLDSHTEYPESPSKRRKIESAGEEPWTVTTTSKPKKSKLAETPPVYAVVAGSSRVARRKSAQVKTPLGQNTLKVKSVIDLTAMSSPAESPDGMAVARARPGDGHQADTISGARASSPTFTSPIMADKDGGRIISRREANKGARDQPLGFEAGRSGQVPMPARAKHSGQPTAEQGNRRQQLVLSSTKRKSSLMCVQSNTNASAAASRSTSQVRFDDERGDEPRQRCRRTSPLIRQPDHARVPFRDAMQRPNMMSNLKCDVPKPQSSSKASLNRASLARSRSDPTALILSVDAATKNSGPPLHPKRAGRQPIQRTLKRAQTLGATAAAEFKIPDSIFSQLPPEIDRDKSDLGPWSREALDLFDWRPPDWEERLASRPSAVTMVD